MKNILFKAWNEREKQMSDPFKYGSQTLLFRTVGETAITYRSFGNNDELLLFTGLSDKNGKDIYEGDQCKTYSVDVGNLIRKVEFRGGSFVFTHQFCLNEELRGFKTDYIEVVGDEFQPYIELPDIAVS